MKKIQIISILALLITMSAKGNDQKFIEAMKKNINIVYNASSMDEIQTAINAFERIGEVEKTRWEPFYYAAFGYVMLCNREQNSEKKDQYLDLAMAAIEKCKTLQHDESELYALQGFIYMMRVSIDPATRGAQLAGSSVDFYKKAIEINPENPRSYALLAQMQYGTAQFFGSSTDEACGNLVVALQKFDSYRSENPLAPTWGKGMAESLKSKCN